ncbi:MAG: GNAT family N-acetyltransferase [Negativicutes bacterium]|nr:GNAT family N-acetyltransferase [Negativicutes bacterium]
MDFRMVGPGDEEARWLWDYCFEKKSDPFYRWYFSRFCQEDNILAAYHGGKMAACLHLNPYELALRGSVLPVSYIVGLGVMPEARGGAAGPLLAASLAEMRRRGHFVSIIMPARAGTYYPYQWEMCYHTLHYSVAPGDLAGLGAKWGEFRLAGAADAEALDDIYRSYVSRRHGYAIRRQANWELLLAEHTLEDGRVYVVENEGRAEGYLFFRIAEGRLIVREMAYTGRQAQQALLRFLYQHASQARAVEWNAPLDDTLHLLLADPKRAVNLEPLIAGRIVDVAKALAAVTYPAGVSGRVILAVEDKLAPWNDGTFALAVAGGTGTVEALGERPGGAVSCTVGGLTQLLFGRLNTAECAGLGRLTGDAAALALLDAFFPKCSNYINEQY